MFSVPFTCNFYSDNLLKIVVICYFNYLHTPLHSTNYELTYTGGNKYSTHQHFDIFLSTFSFYAAIHFNFLLEIGINLMQIKKS